MNVVIRFLLFFVCTIFVLFILFLIFYITILKERKNKKNIIIKYVLKQANDWIYDCQPIREYSIEDLHSRHKMYNTGVGNNGENLKINNYTFNSKWLIKI